MRNYAKAAPTFWTGETARLIRDSGKITRDVQVVAFYLFTCPNSNWIGLYYLPIPTICHEVLITKEPLLRAIERLQKMDFAYYDLGKELVWVPGSAKFQISETLKPEDKRIKGIMKDLQAYKDHKFAWDFYKRYEKAFNLPEFSFPEGPSKGLPRPISSRKAEQEAPSKGLISENKGPSEGLHGDPTEAEAETEARTEARTEAEAGNGRRAFGGPLLPAPESQRGLYAEEDAVFLKIPLVDKTEYELKKSQIAQWTSLYPAIDVEQHCRNYLGWAMTNPEKRKTRTGILKSINTWLQDKQNNPKYHKTPTGSGAQNEQPRPRNPHDSGPDYQPKKRD
jgi:hypothetical protein